MTDLQSLINSGIVWRMEGSMGRAAMDAIHNGECLLGETGSIDYWGNIIPSRYEVMPGTPGSIEYYERMNQSRWS